MPNIQEIADKADVVVNGYAFTRRADGDSVLQNRGILTDKEIGKIQQFIKEHYQDMYCKWAEYSKHGFYEK
jgi:hypothetical protein